MENNDRDYKYDRKSRDNDYDDDGERGGKGKKDFGASFRSKKVCKFCTEAVNLDYKNPKVLGGYLTEYGKIVPRRVSGNCAFAQRVITREIKKARSLGLLGYVVPGPLYERERFDRDRSDRYDRY